MTKRKALFRATTTTLCVAVSAAAVIVAAPAGNASTPTHIAVIGDSYTSGSDEGGRGAQSWPELAWQLLAKRGVEIDADVAAEGGAGYGQPGSRGSVFEDLAAQAVRRNDVLVVFFGARNDQPIEPGTFPGLAAETFQLARFGAPGAKFLVIGPPWPSADPPPEVLKIRDGLRQQVAAAGAVFVDRIAESWFVDRPDLIGGDGVHPTDAGHRYMAERIAPLIYDQLTIRV